MPPPETPGQTLVLPSDRPTQPPDAFLTPSPSPTLELSWFDVLLFGLTGVLPGVPTEPDDTGDGVGADGMPRNISPDLDITDTYVGWTEFPPEVFGPKGFFDCASDKVLCSNDGAQPPEGYSVLGALRTAQPIQLGIDRAGQVAMIFDRVGFPNSPPDGGGFGGADLVVIGDLTGEGSLFVLEWKKNQWQIAPRRAAQAARILIEDQTVLFGVPTRMDEDPGVRFLTFERIPPTQAGIGVLDVAPRIYAFFDVFYELNFPPRN